MSRVTTLILYTGQTYDGRDTAVDEVNAALRDMEGPRLADGSSRWWFTSISDGDVGDWGGIKWPTHVWGGAFDHFPLMFLARILVGIPWEDPDAVTLMVHVEQDADSGFRAYRLADLRELAAAR